MYSVFVSGKDSTITRQRESDSFCERVHRIGSEHTRAAAATRTWASLNLSHLLVTYRGVGSLNHRCDQVGILTAPSTSLHRTTRTEHGGNIQSHWRHQHTGCHLVAVGYAYHGICLVGIDHILHRVGDNISWRKRIEHTVVSHGNTIVDGDSVEFCCITTHGFNFLFYYLTNFMEMCMTRYKLREWVDDGNNWLAELFTLHTSGNPQSPCSCHPSTFSAHGTS